MSKVHNGFILVVADCFTKYVLLFPLKAATVKAIVVYLESDVFLIYGVPEIVIWNNGKQYVGRVFKQMLPMIVRYHLIQIIIHRLILVSASIGLLKR